MSVKSQTSIQQLLAAEKRASEIVAEAKRNRTVKLRQAKDEADREIQRFKDERENAFQAWKSQNSGSSSTFTEELKLKTDRVIATVKQNASREKEAVVKMLLHAVQNIA